MLLDLDHFKRLNDVHGHAAGDAVLRGFATMVTSQLRREDVFARYGGEEFSILLPETTEADALMVAERIRAAVERMDVRFGEEILKTTVSIGITPMADRSFEAALALEDTALYRAKSLGRNRVEISD
jgi:diguanylate cyclase (GGDEF)-like protein